MKKKHLLLSACVALGLQFVQAQDFPTEQRIQEIKTKIAQHPATSLPIQNVLDEDEFKDYLIAVQADEQSVQNTFRGEGDLLWSIESFEDEFLSTPKAGPYTSTVEGSNGSRIFADDINGDGVLYGVDYDTFELVEIFNNGTTENVITLNVPNNYTISGLSWNSTNDTYYLMTFDGTNAIMNSIAMDTGDVTPLVTIPNANGIWLEIDNSGVAYTADIINDILYSYDIGSDTLTEVGTFGYNLNYAQDADFDSETGTLYAGIYYSETNGNYAAIATVDTSTGQLTLLSEPVAGKEYVTFSIADTLAEGPEPPAVGLNCGEVFADSGGLDGYYQNNEDETYVLEPDNAGEAVTITFTFVDIEVAATGIGIQDGCWDYLSIYDGSTVESPVIAPTLCGEATQSPSVPSSNLSVGDSFTSTDASGALTVTFKSDNSVREGGWAADISCAVMAVDEVQAATFNFYPNPTTNLLQVSAKSNIERLELYNVLGQKVYDVKPDALGFSINMGPLKAGTYILRATVDGKVVTNKVMKK